jgi:hypothetical protein
MGRMSNVDMSILDALCDRYQNGRRGEGGEIGMRYETNIPLLMTLLNKSPQTTTDKKVSHLASNGLYFLCCTATLFESKI